MPTELEADVLITDLSVFTVSKAFPSDSFANFETH